MKFLFPLGFLALLGVPILIAIYIIKNKYTEQTVSSTYLWTLSERFIKRRNPLSRITGIVSLILQLLAVILLAFALSQPIIIKKGAANDYCFILDASGSMNIAGGDGTQTRFERGKAEIEKLISASEEGSSYSLLIAGDGVEYLFDRTENREEAISLLKEVQPDSTAFPEEEAVKEAQRVFSENPAAKVYLVTDTEYLAHNNVTVVNVTDEAENSGVTVSGYELKDGKLTIYGSVAAFTEGEKLTLELYLDGAETAAETLEIPTSAEAPVHAFEMYTDCNAFSTARVSLKEKDGLNLDDEYILFNPERENAYETLIVSDNPFFLYGILSSAGKVKADIVSPKAYSEDMTGYGLYVFDGFSPETLPANGAIWLFNPKTSSEGAGFQVQDTVEFSEGEEEALRLSAPTSSEIRKLTEHLDGEGLYVKRYQKCGLYRSFATLMTVKGNPAIFTGTADGGNREVVFAFDLHDSNIAVTPDFGILMKHLWEYSFPDLLESTTYVAGETLTINLPAGCDGVKVESPSGKITYPAAEGAVGEIPLSEVGIYTVTLTAGETTRVVRAFSSLPEEERIPTCSGESFNLAGEAKEGGRDGSYDGLTLILAILLAVVVAADWGVYCYDKYQLR